MSNRNYIRGRNFEYLVRKWLQQRKFFVARQYGSRFPDLPVMGNNMSFFIECKSTSDVPKDPIKLLSFEEIEDALTLVRSGCGPVILAHKERDNPRKWRFTGLEEEGRYIVEELERMTESGVLGLFTKGTRDK